MGALVPVLLFGAVALWAVFHFESFWSLLHLYLIPDGIFSTTEPIMQFFPLELFKGYLQPVAITFGILAAATLALPLALLPLCKNKTTKKHS